jgi:hypothetical protein
MSVIASAAVELSKYQRSARQTSAGYKNDGKETAHKTHLCKGDAIDHIFVTAGFEDRAGTESAKGPNHRILREMNGEPGGTRTRDHRIKSAFQDQPWCTPCVKS